MYLSPLIGSFLPDLLFSDSPWLEDETEAPDREDHTDISLQCILLLSLLFYSSISSVTLSHLYNVRCYPP